MIDTHCHLYLEEFGNDITEVMERAREKNVRQFFLPAINKEYHQPMIELENRYPEEVRAMMGLHPCYVKTDFEDELREVERWLALKTFSAIGEIGLDMYWDQTFMKQQYRAFNRQLELAIKYNLPVVIHSRNATRECIDVIREFGDGKVKGIFHCFGGTSKEAEEIISLGMYLGIGGVVTYKNSGLDKVLAGVSMNNIVLETDAPYLSPVPFRGKRNESSYLHFVAEKIASIYATTVEEVDRVTTLNATNIFGLSF